ncbi:hypothetical protein LOK49_LG02G02642 [Camellia lanceoleosa]|uniref:Uncharacterized protein n=1 Tax=Camellia lanceoleosa TaxID=1840588 RepID=A0ACC0IS53_9ERIC|nr:hypothetical protein LOK49_LG02G02642 [Camellia lanceoleosa]
MYTSMDLGCCSGFEVECPFFLVFFFFWFFGSLVWSPSVLCSGVAYPLCGVTYVYFSHALWSILASVCSMSTCTRGAAVTLHRFTPVCCFDYLFFAWCKLSVWMYSPL